MQNFIIIFFSIVNGIFKVAASNDHAHSLEEESLKRKIKGAKQVRIF